MSLTKEEQALLKKLQAKKGGSKKGGSKKGSDGEPPKLSGCKYEESYKNAEGETVHRPKLWGWRKTKQHGFQSFTAYLDKNNGRPRKSGHEDECKVFVVNLVTEGVGEQTLTGVWSNKYRKLSITKLGLVANPFAERGGYFGRGGSRYKDKVNK